MSTTTKFRRRRRSSMDRQQMAIEALKRAEANTSEANYPLIISGFVAKGIPAAEILPRENVFTYHAWRAKGRQVKRGEHGVAVPTVVDIEFEVTSGTEPTKSRARATASVFHISQTCAIGEPQPEPLKLHEPTSRPAHGSPVAPQPIDTDRLREWASGLDAKIAHAERPLSQNWTRKRGSQLSSRLCDAANMRTTQKALNALADAHDAGTCPAELVDLRPSKGLIASMVHRNYTTTPDSCGSFYPTYVLCETYADQSPGAVALQQLVDGLSYRGGGRDELQQKMFVLEAKIRRTEIDGFFPTPRELAERMVELAKIQPGDEVLEPSAGMGHLLLAVLEKHPRAEVMAIEKVPLLCEYLELIREQYHDRLYVYEGDCQQAGGEVDRVVMNPPYENAQDILQVWKAFQLLRPGGRLVALVSEGPFFRQDAKSRDWRNWLDDTNSNWGSRTDRPCVVLNEQLVDAFKGPQAFNQTGVAVRLLVLDKPKGGA